MSRPSRKTASSFPAKANRRATVRPVDPPPGLLQGLIARFQKLIRPDATPKVDGATVTMTLRNPWRAVGIAPGKHCCQASQQTDTRYLCEEAPRLPLAACTNPAGCHCTYRHFEDRRKSPRRSRDGAARPTVMHHAYSGEADRRRTGGGRRITD
jgi:hypothetical protein